MARYSKRDYQVGEWWLGQRDGSAGYYAIRYDAAKRYNERVSLGTSELEVAKEKLTELYLRTRLVTDERPEAASLADILRRYWEEHASKLRSAKSNRHCINVWLDHWEDAAVSDLDVRRQEAFHTWMRARGYKRTAMVRVINIGKAALNRALKQPTARTS